MQGSRMLSELRCDPVCFPSVTELVPKLECLKQSSLQELVQRFHHSDAVLRVPHLHPNMKTLNWHRHGSICTSPANSAMCQRPAASNHSRFAANGARPAWTSWLTPDR